MKTKGAVIFGYLVTLGLLFWMINMSWVSLHPHDGLIETQVSGISGNDLTMLLTPMVMVLLAAIGAFSMAKVAGGYFIIAVSSLVSSAMVVLSVGFLTAPEKGVEGYVGKQDFIILSDFNVEVNYLPVILTLILIFFTLWFQYKLTKFVKQTSKRVSADENQNPDLWKALDQGVDPTN